MLKISLRNSDYYAECQLQPGFAFLNGNLGKRHWLNNIKKVAEKERTAGAGVTERDASLIVEEPIFGRQPD
jgi:hypothetical protein